MNNKKEQRLYLWPRHFYRKRWIAFVMGLLLLCQPLNVLAAEWQRVGNHYQMPDGTMIQGAIARGIDVSHWKGEIDWNKVAADDVKFVMLGTRYQGAVDPYFIQNAVNAKAAGLEVGAYIYSYATTVEMAQQEADFVLDLIKDYPISYPIAFDAEDANTLGTLSPDQVSEIINAFCQKIQAAGYYPVVYANEVWLKNKIDLSAINYDIWVARYNTMYTYTNPAMWQATNTGSVNGVNGAVDIDFLFKDFSSVIPANTWRTIAGNQYYYQNHQMKKDCWIHDGTGWFYMNGTGNPAKGWMATGAGNYYLDETTGRMATGWQTLAGNTYYFNPEGVMTTGWQDVENLRYYMNDQGHRQIGWQNVGGNWYYLNDTGAMQIGWQDIGGTWYYLDGSGIMQTGWQDIAGARYYLNKTGIMQTGWQNIDGGWYYLADSGAVQTGWQDIAGSRYYLNEAGVMQTGWQDIAGSKYYFNGSGIMQTGWQELDGRKYYFNETGAMQTSWQNLNGSWYYFDDSGVMQTGWQDIAGSKYYLNEAGVMQSGWQELDGNRYYFNDSGILQTGWINLGGIWYYTNENGVLLTGWQQINGALYYLDVAAGGQLATNTTLEADGVQYQADANGACTPIQAQN